jgi:hypothetical protein
MLFPGGHPVRTVTERLADDYGLTGTERNDPRHAEMNGKDMHQYAECGHIAEQFDLGVRPDEITHPQRGG